VCSLAKFLIPVLMMPKVILVLTCVAYMGHARRVHGRSEREQGNAENKASTPFAKLLLASNEALFNPSGPAFGNSMSSSLHRSVARRPSPRVPVPLADVRMQANPTYALLGLEDRAAGCIEDGCSVEDIGDLLTELTAESAGLAARQQSILVTISRLQALAGTPHAADANREEIERIIRSASDNFASLEKRAQEAKEAEEKMTSQIDAVRYDAEVSLQKTAAFWIAKGKEDAKAAAAEVKYKSELDLQRTAAFWIEKNAKDAAAQVEAAKYEAELRVQAAEARAAKAEAEAKRAREAVPEIRALLDRLAPAPEVVPEVKEKPVVKPEVKIEPKVEVVEKVSEDILPYQKAALAKMSLQDLRAELASLGQPTTGLKEDLEQRLESVLNVQRLKTKVWDSVSGAWVDAVPVEGEKGVVEDFVPYTKAVVTADMSVDQLRSELSALGLPTTGMREDLERRLEEGKNDMRMKTSSWDAESGTWVEAVGPVEDFVPYAKAVVTDEMSVQQMRSELSALGLPTTGMREDLERRLEEGKNDMRMKTSSWDSVSGTWVEAAGGLDVAKGPAGDFFPYEKALATDGMSVETLRAQLSELGLPTTGMREELARRLEAGRNDLRMKTSSWDSESGKWVG